MGIFDERLLAQIEKSEQRAKDAGIDVAELVRNSQGKHPRQLATDLGERDERQDLLARTLDDTPEVSTFERLIDGNELQPINYLAHGVVAARPICRITINETSGRQLGYATGFLIAPNVLLTNNHVFPSAAMAQKSRAEFDFETDVSDKQKISTFFDLQPQRLFLTSAELDFSVVAVQPRSGDGKPLSRYGYLPLIDAMGKIVEGEWMTIIQHPGGQQKQVCVRENKFLKKTETTIWYSTDTTGGSSGSPVFNNSWQVVALHHQGVPQRKDGNIQTIDGRDYDQARDTEASIKWIANEGMRVSRLVQEIRRQAPNEPLLEPVLHMTPERAQTLMNGFAVGIDAATARLPLSPSSTAALPARPALPARIETAMTSRSFILDIGDDGDVAIRAADGSARESFSTMEAARSGASARRRPPDYDVPFDPDYEPTGKRKGFHTGFLGTGFDVQLPDLGALKRDATPLMTKNGRHGPYVLDYHGYSLIMHKTRKLAIYTAANIDGGGRYKLGRPHDQWRFDPRIPRTAQIGAYYYANNQFDRGHLTRYEDMEYGATVELALGSAADTLHFTNCSPQHAKFNQGKELWQGLEQHILEQSIKSQSFRAQVFTGPVLDEGDPVWERFKEVQYPLRFWKIAVAQTSANKLFAAGFILDQSDVIAKFGIEATVEVPFSEFKTYQVPIAEIERLTGLTFKSGTTGKLKSLSEADPLKSGASSRRVARTRVTTNESTGAQIILPPGYLPLDDTGDIVTPEP